MNWQLTNFRQVYDKGGRSRRKEEGCLKKNNKTDLLVWSIISIKSSTRTIQLIIWMISCHVIQWSQSCLTQWYDVLWYNHLIDRVNQWSEFAWYNHVTLSNEIIWGHMIWSWSSDTVISGRVIQSCDVASYNYLRRHDRMIWRSSSDTMILCRVIESSHNTIQDRIIWPVWWTAIVHIVEVMLEHAGQISAVQRPKWWVELTDRPVWQTCHQKEQQCNRKYHIFMRKYIVG
jgi:hypothetical protein